VRAQHVDRPDRRYLGRVRVIVDLVGRPVGRVQPAAHKPECQAPELHPLPVEYVVPGTQVLAPQLGDVHVAVGQVGGLGQRGEQLRVLAGGGIPDVLGGIAAELPPEPGGQGPRLVEPFRRPQRDELPRRVGAEQVREDSLPVIGVVHEQQQIPEAQQRVRARRRMAQRAGRPVYVAHHVNPHADTLGRVPPVSCGVLVAGVRWERGSGAGGMVLLFIRRVAAAP
jgi:hypothetical protein